VLEGDLRSILISAAGDASTWAQVAAALREEIESHDGDALRWLIWAFEFGLDAWHAGGPSDMGPFVPMLGFNDGSSYPPALAAIDEPTLTVWADAAGTDGPVIASRLNDLLWERRWGDQPHLHARAARSAYMELARGTWDAIYRAECLVRALQLARSLNDDDLVEGTVLGAMAFTRETLADDHATPGAPFAVLSALVGLPRQSRPEGLDELLSRAEHLFEHDASLFEPVTQMKIAQAEDRVERDRLKLSLVDRWLETADRDKGLG
jgi:hypothetical protein